MTLWNTRVQPNSSMRGMPALAYNNFISAAEITQDLTGKTSDENANTFLLMRKVMGVARSIAGDVKSGNIVGIGEPRVLPADNPAGFQANETWYDLETPNSLDHPLKWGVAESHLPNEDSVGSVIVFGPAKTIINMTDDTHQFADIDDKDTMVSTADPSKAPIIWVESGTGTGKNAIVFVGPMKQGGASTLIYKAVADQSGATVSAKAMGADGTLAPTAELLDVFSNLYKIRNGDYLALVTDLNGDPVAVRIQGCSDSVHTLVAGTGAAAQTDTWNINNQPSGKQGVSVAAWFRLYWSGTSGDPVYQFVRSGTYDSAGNLIAVSAETRSTAFTTGDC